ncbi:hypothetical protein EMQ25_05765 [Arsenicitalea aurantiaca]|uniref:Uncharacterized protein n=1 Tax=Arsenicitalea aurantiaca TaxID=1783274 RepID=A0A433XF10_9HYPH|nr:hypothetical protein [Arsenicitalea aurantiaca]RUT32652.1 hypothetical protein EMQ25_05765 [Arsenicitalea aurantiaca]
MTVTHVMALRNALATTVKEAHEVGSGTATLVLRDGSDPIVTFNLAATPFGAASSGIITAASTPIEATASDSGPGVDNFITYDKNGDPQLSGSVTAVGMGGDIEVTNTNIALGQDCSLESLTYEAPQ